MRVDRRSGRNPCRCLLLTIAIGFIVSCGGPTEPDPEPDPEPEPDPGLTFVAGTGQSDTVDAMPAQALIVEVQGENGALLSGEPVHFSASTEGSGYQERPTVLVGSLGSTGFAGEMVDSTDVDGRVGARIKMGRTAGPGGVVVTVPEQGFRDTARYTIEPGSADRITASPSDTALFVDHSYTISATVRDRYGNSRPSESPEIATESEVVTISGERVTGQNVGRSGVVVRLEEIADTSRVSVVPQGEFAVIENTSGTDEVIVRGLDGSNPRHLTSMGYGARGLTSWSANGESIVYWEGDTQRLRIVDMQGGDRRLMSTPVAQVEEWPHYSRDGQWVYWAGDPGSGARVLFRVKPDGSSAEQIGPDAADSWVTDHQPTPSPDGDRLAYVSSRNATSLHILDVATGTSTDLGIDADRPRWSPVDDRIAFTAGRQVKIAHPAGTVSDITGGSGVEYRGGLTWSPDGSWLLVAKYYGGLELLDPETGQRVPLPFTNRQMSHPSWRPVTGN